jgi:hypothetical protein
MKAKSAYYFPHARLSVRPQVSARPLTRRKFAKFDIEDFYMKICGENSNLG